MQIFRDIGARADEARTLNNLGLIRMNLGDYERAITHFEQVIAIDNEIGSQYAKGVALHNLGRTYLLQGQYIRATSYYQQALTIALATNDRDGEARTLRNLGLMQLYCGDYAGALSYFEQALTIVNEIDSPLGQTRTLRYLGLQAHYIGDQDRALRYSTDAFSIAEETGYRTEQADALMLRGHALWAMAQAEKAVDAYQKAWQIRQVLGEQHLAIESLAGLAGAQQELGTTESARQQVKRICQYITKDPTLAGTVAPLRIYWICYKVLQAVEPNEAIALLHSAHKLLLTRAKQFTLLHRERYLQKIDVHRQILAEVTGAEIKQRNPVR